MIPTQALLTENDLAEEFVSAFRVRRRARSALRGPRDQGGLRAPRPPRRAGAGSRDAGPPRAAARQYARRVRPDRRGAGAARVAAPRRPARRRRRAVRRRGHPRRLRQSAQPSLRLGPAARRRDPGLGRRARVRGPGRHAPPGSPRHRQALPCRPPRRSADGRRRAAPRCGRAARHEPLLQARPRRPAPDSRGRGARRAVAGHERRSPIPHGAGRTRVSAVLEVRGARYALPQGRVLVEDASFGVAPGATLVLPGRRGPAKTTALKLSNGLLEPTAGEIRIARRPTYALEATRLRRRIGYVIQEIGLVPHLTGERNLGLVQPLEGGPAARHAAAVRGLPAPVR